MYAHQVIEDIKRAKIFDDVESNEDIEKWKDRMSASIHFIQTSQKFHGGVSDDIIGLFKGDIGLIFSNEMSKKARLPYKKTWVDFIDKSGNKLGMLVWSFSEIDDLLAMGLYIKPRGVEPFFMLPMSAFVSIGKTFGERSEDPNIIKVMGGRKPPESLGNILFSSIKYTSEAQRDMAFGMVSLVEKFLIILNCKNITTERISAPEALNKKRRKSGKQELFDYHVLNVVVPSKKRGYHETTEPLSHNRVHLCRGHFKEYTKEHPLFGRLVGLYWWQPCVRGQNKDGVVMKDYNLNNGI